jgi:hypothetical protein
MSMQAIVYLSEVAAQPHEIEAVLLHEGGEWKPVRSYGFPEQLHAARTHDGRVWDAYNGWRTGRVVGWYRNEMG